MEVSFSSADWVISLGVGVEIPRMGERLDKRRPEGPEHRRLESHEFGMSIDIHFTGFQAISSHLFQMEKANSEPSV